MAEIVINDIDPIIGYTAAGGELSYDYGFPIFEAADLVVLQILSDGTVSILSNTVDYTLSGVGAENGGTMTFTLVSYPTGAIAGARYVLYRDKSVSRGTDFLKGGDFTAAKVNRELDNIIMMIQQNELEIKRSLGLQKADPEDELNFKVETAADRSGKILKFGANGDTVEVTSLASLSLSGLDTLFSAQANNDFFIYDGTNWVNKNVNDVKIILDLKLNRYDAIAAPTVNDDSNDGYAVGSQWYDITGDDMYVCVDATVGAAVWQQGDILAADLGAAAVKGFSTDTTFLTDTAALRDAAAIKSHVDAKSDASGRVLQTLLNDTAITTGMLNGSIPIDDTIPQNDEGVEVMNISITPKKSNSKIKITMNASYFSGQVSGYVMIAIFKNSDTDAFFSKAHIGYGSGFAYDNTVMAIDDGNTAGVEVTYSVRVGGQSANVVRFNELGTQDDLGGSMKPFIQVEEIAQ